MQVSACLLSSTSSNVTHVDASSTIPLQDWHSISIESRTVAPINQEMLPSNTNGMKITIL